MVSIEHGSALDVSGKILWGYKTVTFQLRRKGRRVYQTVAR